MATIITGANGNPIYATDPNGNEITKSGKIIAGILLISFTLLAIVAIIAHWPDRLPRPNGPTKYCYKLFAVNYADTNGLSNSDTSTFSRTMDTTKAGKPDSNGVVVVVDSLPVHRSKIVTDSNAVCKAGCVKKCKCCTIDLNTLLLLLVAIAGFLGNLIHISASFTNFVGAGKFKRSWALWYCVKPFTAAALAIGLYVVFRAGFLNSTEATASVNLYGVVAMGFFAGLFTDKATDKLKEVFGVIFQSSMTRPDAIDTTHKPAAVAPTVTDISPTSLVVNTLTPMIITGTALDTAGLVVTVGGTAIADTDLTKTATSITFNYTAAAAGDLVVVVTDDKGNELKNQTITAA